MSVDRGLVRSPQKSHNKGAWAGGSLLAILDALQDPLLSEQSKVKKNVHNRHHLCKKGVNVTVCSLVFSKGNNGRTKWKIKKSIVYAGKKSRRGGGSEVAPNTSYLIVLTLEPTTVYNSKQN